MLKKTLILLLWLGVAFTGKVWADEPLQTWPPRSRLRSDTAVLTSPEPSDTWQSTLTRFGPPCPDENDRMLYCVLNNGSKVIRSEASQTHALEDKSSQKNGLSRTGELPQAYAWQGFPLTPRATL